MLDRDRGSGYSQRKTRKNSGGAMIERSFHRMSDMDSDDERDGAIRHL